VIAAVAILLAAAFGAGDQYLGSVPAWIAWAPDVSLLSAPWLVIAFLAGRTQRDPRRAALLGLGCTAAALAGYGLMTLSPLENAHYSLHTIRGFAVSESPVLVGGVVTGPLFGWFGQQWRTKRAWFGALATAALVALEPLVRIPAGHEIRFRPVALAEAAAGLAMAFYVISQKVDSRRRGSS
jgi:hypothetical protein